MFSVRLGEKVAWFLNRGKMHVHQLFKTEHNQGGVHVERYYDVMSTLEMGLV